MGDTSRAVTRPIISLSFSMAGRLVTLKYGPLRVRNTDDCVFPRRRRIYAGLGEYRTAKRAAKILPAKWEGGW